MSSQSQEPEDAHTPGGDAAVPVTSASVTVGHDDDDEVEHVDVAGGTTEATASNIDNNIEGTSVENNNHPPDNEMDDDIDALEEGVYRSFVDISAADMSAILAAATGDEKEYCKDPGSKEPGILVPSNNEDDDGRVTTTVEKNNHDNAMGMEESEDGLVPSADELERDNEEHDKGPASKHDKGPASKQPKPEMAPESSAGRTTQGPAAKLLLSFFRSKAKQEPVPPASNKTESATTCIGRSAEYDLPHATTDATSPTSTSPTAVIPEAGTEDEVLPDDGPEDDLRIGAVAWFPRDRSFAFRTRATMTTTVGGDAIPNTMVTANPVLEDYPEAEEVTNPETLRRPSQRQKRSFFEAAKVLVAGFLLVAAVVGVVVGIVVAIRNSQGEEKGQGGIGRPTPGMSTREFVESLLPPYTLRVIQEQDDDSPQAQALEWILGDPRLEEYPAWRIQQRFALAVFYHATVGSTWFNHKGWLEYGLNECEWYTFPYQSGKDMLGRYWYQSELEWHVALWDYYDSIRHSSPCESIATTAAPTVNAATNGTFRHLWQFSNNLKGSIPPELSMLTGLETLNFMANDISGTIPTQIGLLAELDVILIGLSQLFGTLPSELGMLGNLRAFFSYHNPGLNGLIPSEIGQLSQNLRYATFFSHTYSGVPSEIGHLSKLQMLRVDTNQLTIIPSEIGLMTDLLWLDIGDNPLTELPSEIGSLTSLHDAEIFNCGLTTIPSELGTLTSMKILHLYDNGLAGPVPPELVNLAGSLIELNLANNNFDGKVPEELFQLDYLNLAGNSLLEGIIPDSACDAVHFDCSNILCGCSCDCLAPIDGNATHQVAEHNKPN